MAYEPVFTEPDGNGVAIFYGDTLVPRAGETASIDGTNWSVEKVHYDYPASDASVSPTRVRVIVKKKPEATGRGWFM